MLVLAVAVAQAACTAKEEVRRVELRSGDHALTLAIPAAMILNQADDGYYVTLGLSYPSLAAAPPGGLPDVFLVLKSATHETAAERLETSDAARPGVNVPRLVGQTENRKDFQYFLGAKSTEPIHASVYRTETGWLSVEDAGRPFQSIDFDRRFGKYFELNYKVTRNLVADPLVVDHDVAQFIQKLVVASNAGG